MNVYTYSEARQNLASLLEEAARKGEVRIKRKDGQIFSVRPQLREESPLDVEGIDLEITADEIVGFIREGRRTSYAEMAQDEEREAEALEWSEATIGDVSDETR